MNNIICRYTILLKFLTHVIFNMFDNVLFNAKGIINACSIYNEQLLF